MFFQKEKNKNLLVKKIEKGLNDALVSDKNRFLLLIKLAKIYPENSLEILLKTFKLKIPLKFKKKGLFLIYNIINDVPIKFSIIKILDNTIYFAPLLNNFLSKIDNSETKLNYLISLLKVVSTKRSKIFIFYKIALLKKEMAPDLSFFISSKLSMMKSAYQNDFLNLLFELSLNSGLLKQLEQILQNSNYLITCNLLKIFCKKLLQTKKYPALTKKYLSSFILRCKKRRWHDNAYYHLILIYLKEKKIETAKSLIKGMQNEHRKSFLYREIIKYMQTIR